MPKHFHYTRKELEALPTLATGQADDLKIDTGDIRVWLSRCTIADGEPYNHKVTIEAYLHDKWITIGEYPAESEDDEIKERNTI